MPHINTKPGQHDLTASAFIFRNFDGTPKMLLHMHKKISKLMQPGGHVELNENPWQAVLHEIEEETGYHKSQLYVLQPEWAIEKLTGVEVLPVQFCTNTHPIDEFDHYHTDLSYVFTVDSDPSVELGIGESTDLRWKTYEEIEAMPEDKILVNAKEIALSAFSTCLPNWAAKPVVNDE